MQDIFKNDSSNNIKVTFKNQHMVSDVLSKGLILFNLSRPAHDICREIFVDILPCFKCYQLEDHKTSSCPKSNWSVKYAHFVPLKNKHTVNAFLAFCSVSTVKKRETIIAPLL